MATFLKKIPRVLVMVTPTSQKVLREKTQGIMRYAHLHGPWEVHFLENSPFVSGLGSLVNWHPDGIITRSSPAELRGLLKHGSRIPTVFLDAPQAAYKRCVSIHHDVRRASEAVAEAYLRQGFKNFAYVGSASVPQPFWSSERGEAFAAYLRGKGCDCAFYCPKTKKDWGIEQRHLLKWLLGLPKPCGLFAAFDLLAKQVLDTCLSAGINVPDDVAVVGVDDDETICENTVPTLSSVQSDFECGAYMAAELLDQMMRGKIRKKTLSATYGFKRIIHRQSSLYVQTRNRCVTNALEFIRLNACEGITVNDVAANLHVSRSHVEKQFKRILGHSVLDEIQARRLERLCALLRETALPIGEIGERCGYETEAYLKRLFKRTYGMTMREYRNRHRQR